MLRKCLFASLLHESNILPRLEHPTTAHPHKQMRFWLKMYKLRSTCFLFYKTFFDFFFLVVTYVRENLCIPLMFQKNKRIKSDEKLELQGQDVRYETCNLISQQISQNSSQMQSRQAESTLCKLNFQARTM